MTINAVMEVKNEVILDNQRGEYIPGKTIIPCTSMVTSKLGYNVQYKIVIADIKFITDDSECFI